MVKERDEMMLRECDAVNISGHRHLTETFLGTRKDNGPTDLALESSRMALNAHHFALIYHTGPLLLPHRLHNLAHLRC